ncbi:MAG: gliding motility-associated C-terminal domain-containing protein [Chitinophagales bacterium]
MKRSFTIVLLLFAIAAIAQPSISVTNTTASICFNDGTIQVAGNGGTPPYTFSITNGPAYPSITYPIQLITGVSLFQAIPAGTYTVQVTDANGGVAQTTATVSGSYQFPILNYTYSGNCLSAQGTQGLPPYQYAISSVSQSTGFSAYQSSPDFCNVCGGDFWLRMRDACGNIFTTLKITIAPVAPSVSLSCHKGPGSGPDTLIATGNSGVPPYNYSFTNGVTHLSNNNGVFVYPRSCNMDTVTVTDACNLNSKNIDGCNDFGLYVISKCGFATINFFFYGGVPPYSVIGMGHNLTTHNQVLSIDSLSGGIYTFTISDSCGHTFNYQASCNNRQVFGTGGGPPIIITGTGTGSGGGSHFCHFDSIISMENLTPEWQLPLTVTCTTCTPLQSVVISSPSQLPADMFYHIPPEVPQLLHYTNDYGVDYWDSVTLHSPYITALVNAQSCNDYQAVTQPDSVPFVHWELYNSNHVLLQRDTIGYFANLPNGVYTVILHPDSSGCPNDTTQIVLPKPVGFCYVPTHNATCANVYDIFQGGTKFSESWSLHSNSGIVYPEFPDSNLILYNDIPPGIYTYVSDSGCSFPLTLPPIITPKLNVTTTVNCLGQAVLYASTINQGGCTSSFGYRYELVKNGMVIAGNASGVFPLSDTGEVVARMFYKSPSNFGLLPAGFDSICPIDTVITYATNSTIPYLKATEVKVCGQNAANIPFQIFGGSVPYTLEIQGQPPVTINTNSGIYPGIVPGLYTMIVYDSCGISRSFSVNVRDTCATSCGVHAAFNALPNPICKGNSVHLINQSTNATNYIWLANGLNLGTQKDTSVIYTQPGTYLIKLKAFLQNCVDSAEQLIVVEDSIKFSLGNDTILCGNFARILTTPYSTAHWSTGAIGSQIVATGAGVYWAEVAGACNSVRDSVALTLHYFPAFDLGNDTVLCNQATIDLSVPVDSATFIWSTGSVDSSIHISQQPLNPVFVTVRRNGCVVVDSIHINYQQTPMPFSIGPDSFYCSAHTIIVRSPQQSNWSTGQTADSIVVNTAGMYWAEVSNFCGSFRDSVFIAEEKLPSGFTVNSNKDAICVFAHDSAVVTVSVDATNSSVHFIWPGLIDTGHVSSHVFYEPDTFTVVADNGRCRIAQDVMLKLRNCGTECLEKFALPNALTANGDGLNDTFNIIPLCDIDPFLMRIYNRWGELVFETHSVHEGWDGRINRKQQEQEVLFYYICIGVAGVPDQKCFTGTVTLLK